MRRSALVARPPLVSACLIVRNEEENLPRCLTSIREAVDEIIVVDTGSTDRTREIAREHGAQILEFAWCDDFSAARNESIRHAAGELVLWIDADDELVEQRPGALRELCQSLAATSWGYWMDVHCPTDDWMDGETLVKQARLFRNHIGIHFRGRVHEQATPPSSFALEALSFQDRAFVRHFGYIPKGDRLKRKAERNLKLLGLAIDEEPDEPYHRYNLGLEYAAAGEHEAALAAFEEALQLLPNRPANRDGFVRELFALAARSAVELGRSEAALKILGSVPSKYVSATLLYFAGLALWRQGLPEQAIPHLQRALQDPSVRNPNHQEQGAYTWRPAVALCCIHTELDHYDRAYEFGQQALTFAPDRPEILFIQAHIANKLGLTIEALQLLRRLVGGKRDGGYKAQGRRLMLDIAIATDNPNVRLEALDGEVQGLSAADRLVLAADALATVGRAMFDDLETSTERVSA